MQDERETIEVRVLLFAAFREVVGESELRTLVPSGTTLNGLFTHLERDRSGLAPLRRYTTFAVNREVVDGDTELRAGDEVALLQPVSGGAG